MTSLVHLATITLLGLAAAENGDVHALLSNERQLYTSADCATCTNGCWWTATTPNVGCYAWPKSTCDAQGSAYIWCSSTAPPPAPSPTPITATPTKAPKSSSTTPAPTKKRTKRPTAAPTSSSTSQPTSSSTSPNGCGTCTGCWWTATTSNVGCYTWPQSTCASYGAAYVWCGGGSTPPSPTPTTTTLKPTSIVSPTPTPPTPTPGTGGGGACLVGYWGQNSASRAGGTEGDLITYCNTGRWNLINLAFLVGFNADGTPQTPNFANHWDLSKIGQDISACQARGVKILLSLGGSTGSTSNSVSSSNVNTAADAIWNLYLGGTSSSRPFGSGVTLDGIDLDIENYDRNNANWSTFVTRLRSKFTTGRKYYIAGAPQCPLPDEALGPSGGLALNVAQFDFVFIQFYNNSPCAANTSNYNMGSWMSAMSSTASPNAKLFIGVPASPDAAGSGYISDVNALNSLVNSGSSTWGSRFGGVMTWDVGLAGINDAYWSSVRNNSNGKTCNL